MPWNVFLLLSNKADNSSHGFVSFAFLLSTTCSARARFEPTIFRSWAWQVGHLLPHKQAIDLTSTLLFIVSPNTEPSQIEIPDLFFKFLTKKILWKLPELVGIKKIDIWERYQLVRLSNGDRVVTGSTPTFHSGI